MNLDELETINAAIKTLEKHGYVEAADTLKSICIEEFRLIAEFLKDAP